MGAVSGCLLRWSGLCPSAAEVEKNRSRPAAADFLRVMATLLVGWFHIWQQSWVSPGRWEFLPRTGAVWVDVLVLLSAFCIFLPAANRLAEGKPLQGSPAGFYRRRAVRILPAYYASLLAALAIALAKGGWSKQLGVDLLLHLSLTQMATAQTYLHTQLNGVTWTLTVLALFYLVYPLLLQGMARCPVLTLAGLLAVQLGYSLWLLPRYATPWGEWYYAFCFNQFPAFCGVLAVGLAAAQAFAWLSRCKGLQTPVARLCFLGLGLAVLWGLLRLLRGMNSPRLQYNQLLYRMPLALLAAAVLVCLALGPQPPLGQIWGAAAKFSYSFYLWHQLLAVWLKYDLRLPPWVGNIPPNQQGDAVWAARYNALAWAAAILAAVAGTLLVERPFARWMTPKKTGKTG